MPDSGVGEAIRPEGDSVILSNRLCAAAAVLMSILSGYGQSPSRSHRSLPPERNAARFIVAFELTRENRFAFTWPVESMSPAPYESVLMRIERMPRVRDRRNPGKSRPLLASRCIKVNDRNLGRNRDGLNLEHAFPVKLYHGRLRVSLSIPPGRSLDPEHRAVRIRLYQPPANRQARTGAAFATPKGQRG